MAQVDNLMSIPRPTDLSIKSCMAQKYDVDFDPSNCRMFPNISPEGQQNSPVALVFDGGVSKLENAAARLVVLDSLFAHQNGLVPNLASPASPTYETSPPLKRQRTRDGHFNFMSGLKANHRADQRETTKSSSPPTPTGRGRGCKRKGGWKFHDLSDESDGLGRRKRTYCNNRLENEILQ
uniref:Uncharacterized protein n=1 Tax=Ciona savignyi TaxID=51511 RepID=H2ZCV2_CIOSA